MKNFNKDVIMWGERELAKRFVSDYKLPIQIINEKLFYYSLNTLGFTSLWEYLKKLIRDRFNNDNNEFLQEYYNVRDNIITSVLNNEAYKKFNTMDMKQYSFKNKDNVPSSNIYSQNNIGKTFISIDLKKANFQVINKIDKDILFNSDTYDDFIGKFTDLEYVKESKYTRQVIFGKLNPSKHITIERYYTHKIYELLMDKLDFLNNECKAVSITNDEIVYEIIGNLPNDYSYSISSLIKDELDLQVHVNTFKLKGYELRYKDTNSSKFTFYSKIYDDNTHKLISVPLPYYLIIYKLYNGIPLNENDYHFNYEGCDCIFNEEFVIKEI